MREVLEPKHLSRLATIRKVLAQQTKMMETGSHSAEDRIVSLGQPHVRPIVRGKVHCYLSFNFALIGPDIFLQQ